MGWVRCRSEVQQLCDLLFCCLVVHMAYIGELVSARGGCGVFKGPRMFVCSVLSVVSAVHDRRWAGIP